MTERIMYRLSFDVDVDAIELTWPTFPDLPNQAQYVTTFAATYLSGEPCPTDAINAPFSELLGLPFQYVRPGIVGHSTPPLDFSGGGISEIEVRLQPWGRGVNPNFTSGRFPLVVMGTRRSLPRRTITMIHQGVEA